MHTCEARNLGPNKNAEMLMKYVGAYQPIVTCVCVVPMPGCCINDDRPSPSCHLWCTHLSAQPWICPSIRLHISKLNRCTSTLYIMHPPSPTPPQYPVPHLVVVSCMRWSCVWSPLCRLTIWQSGNPTRIQLEIFDNCIHPFTGQVHCVELCMTCINTTFDPWMSN